jgi:polar amino acid transport system substrate-binding protein
MDYFILKFSRFLGRRSAAEAFVETMNEMHRTGAGYRRISFRHFVAATLSGLLIPVVAGAGIVVTRGERDLAALQPSSLQGNLRPDAGFDRKLRIGVAYLPPPKTPDMRIYVDEGFEADLAHEIGTHLQAEVELVAVEDAEQLAAINEGRVDAVLRRAGTDDPFRRSVEVLSTGFESGLSPVMRSDKPLPRWSELAGKVVCVTQANMQGQQLARSLGAELRILGAPAEALMLVRTGECTAAVHDRALLDVLLRQKFWRKFAGTLPPAGPTELVVGVAKGRGELVSELKRALAILGTAEQWRLREGRWAELVSFEVYRDQVAADCH